MRLVRLAVARAFLISTTPVRGHPMHRDTVTGPTGRLGLTSAATPLGPGRDKTAALARRLLTNPAYTFGPAANPHRAQNQRRPHTVPHHSGLRF